MVDPLRCYIRGVVGKIQGDVVMDSRELQRSWISW